jgi:type IX secretion system PorP/SprF family membrane protein
LFFAKKKLKNTAFKKKHLAKFRKIAVPLKTINKSIRCLFYRLPKIGQTKQNLITINKYELLTPARAIKLHKRERRVIVAFCFFLLAIAYNKVSAQQPTVFGYNQYMDNLTPLNPAYSLLDEAGSVNTLARKQWVGIDGAPTTFLINGNLPIQSINGSAGLIVMNDQFAIEHQTEVNAYFATAIQVGPTGYLAVSLNAGLRNYIANYSSLDSTDPSFKDDIRQTKPNVGFGVLYYTDKYYVGISVPELTVTSLGTASVQNNANFRNHYYFSSAFLTSGEDIKFKPALLLSYENGVPLTANFSGICYFKEILGVGVNYATNSQMAGIITINVDNFHIGYSYQFGTNPQNLGSINMPTHEVTLSFRFGKGYLTPKLL